MHVGCAACTLRACAQAQGLDDCGACPQLPCERLAAFIHDGHPHHRDVPDLLASLRALGPERWLATQRARWTCLCGAHLSWYETTCPRCGAAHAVYIREKP